MTLSRTHSLSLLIAQLSLVSAAAGCMATPEDLEEEQAPELGETAQALDNSFDPDDGKACYVDGPKERKGKMEGGMCCYDTEDGNACVACDKEHQCTVGGGAGPIVALTVSSWWTPPKALPTITTTSIKTFSRSP